MPFDEEILKMLLGIAGVQVASSAKEAQDHNIDSALACVQDMRRDLFEVEQALSRLKDKNECGDMILVMEKGKEAIVGAEFLTHALPAIHTTHLHLNKVHSEHIKKGNNNGSFH